MCISIMSCLVLIGGIIGCGKSTFINNIIENEKHINNSFSAFHQADNSDSVATKHKKIYSLIFDDFCSVEEQASLMKALKGWKNFRSDLLGAAEMFINKLCGSKSIINEPLSMKSKELFNKMTKSIKMDFEDSEKIFLVEDNFYYRSMRYDWFKIARKINIGFCEVFLNCPCDTAIQRNSIRGYKIPAEKIKTMLLSMEYPDPRKYKWEKYSIFFDSSKHFHITEIKDIIDLIHKASIHPAEIMITEDKINAQKVCLRNVIHQADNILRKIVSEKISAIKKNQAKDLKLCVLLATNVRHVILSNIKNGSIQIPQDLLKNLKEIGIEPVQDDYSKFLNNLFELSWIENAERENIL